jgi:NAD(P)H-hydrate epimerase
LDADGINAVSWHILKAERKASLVLTPHPGEMARLWGVTAADVQADRVGYATKTAAETGAVTVLKGQHTLVATPDGTLWENHTGNDGLATGGSGDVLAGVIGSLLAQGLSPADAAVCGVYIHGLAAEDAAFRRSRTAMLPSDVIESLCNVLLALGR